MKHNIVYFKYSGTNQGIIYKFNKNNTNQLKFFQGLDESHLIMSSDKFIFYRNNKKIYIDTNDYNKLHQFILCSKFIDSVESSTDDTLPLLSNIVTIYVDNTFQNIYASTFVTKF
jgi:hypothetical protein